MHQFSNCRNNQFLNLERAESLQKEQKQDEVNDKRKASSLKKRKKREMQYFEYLFHASEITNEIVLETY
jgi:hypothetical protein